MEEIYNYKNARFEEFGNKWKKLKKHEKKAIFCHFCAKRAGVGWNYFDKNDNNWKNDVKRIFIKTI